MGIAGGPHCLAMCGAACTALGVRCGGPRPQAVHLVWQAGRLLAYALAGALVASSVSVLARWGQELSWLRPWWAMLHIAALALGFWMVWQGRVPRWLAAPLSSQAFTRLRAPVAPARAVALQGAPTYRLGLAESASAAGQALSIGGKGSVPAPDAPTKVLWLRAGAAGAAWVALPCGLLQSALVVAALGSSAWEGALVMACFALGSGLSLWLGPAMWARLSSRLGRSDNLGPGHAVRLAGLMLSIGSAWAIGHHVVAPWVNAYCA